MTDLGVLPSVRRGALKRENIHYSDTRATYEAYRKSGYSRKYFEAHREQITIHRAAKNAFDELDMKKIPRAKELSVEIAKLMEEKKSKFAQYRSARDEAKEYLVIQENIASLYDAERKAKDADRRRRREQER